MSGLVLLDSAPLGYVCNPRNREKSKRLKDAIKRWNFSVKVPEIIDYELRRNFELERFEKSLSLLNQFQKRNQILW